MLSRLAVVLLHYPVLNRRGETIATAVTNLDLHDIARICRTFGVGRFYVVTPVPEQQRVVAEIVQHWTEGYGAAHNPHRCSAFQLLRVAADLESAQQEWSEELSAPAKLIMTSAREERGMGGRECRALLHQQPAMLLLGTGSGLAPGFTDEDYAIFQPILGVADYNHLPVRAAAAIILERIFNER